MLKRQLIAVGVAVASPLLGIVAMTAATAAVAHAVMTGSIAHRTREHR